MNARGKIPESLRSLLRSELEKAIYEAALHRDDDLIARRYMIDKWAQADIAAELGWERSTISRHRIYSTFVYNIKIFVHSCAVNHPPLC